MLRKISAVEKKRLFNKQPDKDENESSSQNDSDHEKNSIDGGAKSKKAVKKSRDFKNMKDKAFECDLRHILGFLNQTEWI